MPPQNHHHRFAKALEEGSAERGSQVDAAIVLPDSGHQLQAKGGGEEGQKLLPAARGGPACASGRSEQFLSPQAVAEAREAVMGLPRSLVTVPLTARPTA